MAELFRYAAFISYASKDAAFAKRLHRALEGYGIPSALGQFDLIGGGKKNRIYPVFRDREELSAGDLRERIEAALKASGSMIVVCSPDAGASPWVQKEIEYFFSLGRRERVFAIIADTVPLSDVRGVDPIRDSFPAAVRGNALADTPVPELLAADSRKGKDGFRNAWLKVVAGLLGVTPGQLIDRDKKQRARRRLIIGAAAVVLAAIVLTMLTLEQVYTWRARFSTYAEALIGQGRTFDALPFAIAGEPEQGALISSRSDTVDAALARIGATRIFADLGDIGLVIPTEMHLSVNGKAFFAVDYQGQGALYDLAHGGTKANIGNLGKVLNATFADDGSAVVIENVGGKKTLYLFGEGGRRIDLGKTDSRSGVQFADHGRFLLTQDNLAHVALYDIANGGARTDLGALAFGIGVNIAANGELLLTKGADLRWTLYDLEQGARRSDLGDLGTVTRFAVAARASKFVTLQQDGRLTLYDLRHPGTHEDIGSITPLGIYDTFILSEDGDTLFAWKQDDVATVFDLTRGGTASKLDFPSLRVQSVQTHISSDGKFLVVVRPGRESATLIDLARHGELTDLNDLGRLDFSHPIQIAHGRKGFIAKKANGNFVLYGDLGAGGSALELGDTSRSFKMSSDGRYVITHDWVSSRAKFYDIDRGFRATDLGDVAAVSNFSDPGDALVIQAVYRKGLAYAPHDIVWAGSKPPVGAALASAVCRADAAVLPSFPRMVRDPTAAERAGMTDEDRRLRDSLAGRPWNPCDWRGLAASFPDETSGDGWFEGFRQWLRLARVRYFGGRDYVCGEINARGDISPERTRSCQLNNSVMPNP
jgi:hypothetical protein